MEREKRIFMAQNDYGKRKAVCRRAAGFMAAVKDAEAKLAGTGRILIRPSGTEPLLRIMVEAEDRELARATATATADALTL